MTGPPKTYLRNLSPEQFMTGITRVILAINYCKLRCEQKLRKSYVVNG